MNSTSKTLLARVKHADPESWRLLVEIYRPFLIRELKKVFSGFSESDLADITQEVFLILHKQIARFVRLGNGSFRAYLRVITKRQAIRLLRARNREIGNSQTQELLSSQLEQWADPKSELNDRMEEEYHQYCRQKLIQEMETLIERDESLRIPYEIFKAVSQEHRTFKDVSQQYGVSTTKAFEDVAKISKKLNGIKMRLDYFDN